MMQNTDLPQLIPYKSARMDVREEGEVYILSFENSFQMKVSARMNALLSYLDGHHTLDDICSRAGNELHTVLAPEELVQLIEQQLKPKGVLVGFESKPRHESAIWLRTPLFDGSRLEPAARPFLCMFRRAGAIIALTWILLSLTLFALQFGELELSSTFGGFGRISLAFVLFLFSLALHEFGHIVSAFRYGIKPRDVGVGLYMLMPAFFVDLSELWQIRRLQRVVVNLAGIYFQLMYFGLLEVISFITGNEMLFVANGMILVNVLMNLNPILRYDGFWAITDAIGIVNLHPRVKKLAGFFFKGYILRKGAAKEQFGQLLAMMSGKIRHIFVVYSVLYATAVVTVLSILIFGFAYTLAAVRPLTWENTKGIILLLAVLLLRIIVKLVQNLKLRKNQPSTRSGP